MFVIGVWLALVREQFFSLPSTPVLIWSDGGCKHFKLTPNLLFMSAYQARYPQWRFIYNFFPSYHRDSICDGLTAQGKSAMKRWEKDWSLIFTHHQLVEALSSVWGFNVSLADVVVRPGPKPHITTLPGCCKWYYKYLFPQAGVVSAFEASEDLENKKTWEKSVEMFSFLWQ